MRVEAVCILMRQSGGLKPKERAWALSRFDDEEVVAFETVALDTKKYSDIVGYATTSFLEFVHYDFEEFGFFLDQLIESDYYSEESHFYRFQNRVIFVIEREKLFTLELTEQIIEMKEAQEDQNVTSLQYRKLIDTFVNEFINQFYLDFIVTMETQKHLTLLDYMKEVEYTERIGRFIEAHHIEIVKAIGDEGGIENVFSRKYSVGAKRRFEKDALFQLKKRLKQECTNDHLTEMVHRIV